MIRLINNMIKADRNNERADLINIKSFNKEEESNQLIRELEEKMSLSLDKLANRKRGILITSMKDFIEIYEKIKKIEFQESDGIRELYSSNEIESKFKELESMIYVKGETLNTKQMISTMIIKGGISGLILKESEINMEIARTRKKIADVLVAHNENISITYDSIHKQSERIARLLAELNVLFTKSLKESKIIIDKNGNDRKKYSKYEKICIMNCINFAYTLKKIIDSKLIDSNGKLASSAIEAIKIGESYINEVNKMTK